LIQAVSYSEKGPQYATEAFKTSFNRYSFNDKKSSETIALNIENYPSLKTSVDTVIAKTQDLIEKNRASQKSKCAKHAENAQKFLMRLIQTLEMYLIQVTKHSLS
jgi:hypothetical protein